MTPVSVGSQYVLLDTFPFSGLFWEKGTTVTVVAYPYLKKYFGNTRCGAVDERSPELVILTPVELLSPLVKRRRRIKQVEPEPLTRRRRRRAKNN